jgi:hypothetical protein
LVNDIIKNGKTNDIKDTIKMKKKIKNLGYKNLKGKIIT